MLFKFLWFLVLVWIIGRVFRSAMSIFRIAAGREDPPAPRRAPWPGPDPSTFGPGTRPSADPTSSAGRAAGTTAGPTVHRTTAPARDGAARHDVEDARFEDL